MKRLVSKFAAPLVTAVIMALAGGPLAAPVAAAGSCSGGNTAKGQVQQGIGESGSNCDDSGVASILKVIVNILSFVAGAAAVIMIVIAGVRFTTSGGDSGSVSGAKSALIFAIIGLVVVALAQVIVHFVLDAAINNNVSPS